MSLRVYSLFPLFSSPSLRFSLPPSLSPPRSPPSLPASRQLLPVVFARDIIGYGIQAKEASQREVVMVYILFHPVILANDKDGSSNKSRRRRMLDTERTGREE